MTKNLDSALVTLTSIDLGSVYGGQATADSIANDAANDAMAAVRMNCIENKGSIDEVNACIQGAGDARRQLVLGKLRNKPQQPRSK